MPETDRSAAALNESLSGATRENFEYLVATLSKRTAGKKYENFIVNAIWYALDDGSLRPVTQQHVDRAVVHPGLSLVDLKQEPGSGETSTRALIDLYFPALRLGVEIDEAQHFSASARAADEARTADIRRAIPGYEELRVPVVVDEDGVAISATDVMDAVDDVVRQIRDRQARVARGEFSWGLDGEVAWNAGKHDWEIAREAGVIRAGDPFLFRTNGEIRELFGVGADGIKRDKYGEIIAPGKAVNSFRSNFELPHLQSVVWCPTLAKRNRDGELVATNSGGHLNWIFVEGDEILIGQASPTSTEQPWRYDVPPDEMERRRRTEDWGVEDREGDIAQPWEAWPRITFVRTQDAVGRRGFQFLGVFTPSIGFREHDGKSFVVCRLTSDTVTLPAA